jgi:DNA recombination protein RmuC
MEEALIFVGLAIVAAAILLSRRPAPVPGGRGDGAGALQARVDETAAALAGLAGAFDERRRLEEQAVEALERVERIIAGPNGRGHSGENLLAAALAEFPPEMVVRDFTVGGRVCEFALRMPDGKLLPIDSKWPSTELLDELAGARGPGAEEARRRIEKAVSVRLREVAGYIEPSLTVPLAVAAVPDAVYACCRKAHAVGQQARVLIVSYSLAVPLLLGMWNLYRTYASDVDDAQVRARLHEVSVVLAQLGERLESQLSRGLKMAGNAALDMRSLVTSGELTLRALDRTQPNAHLGVVAGGGETIAR